MLFNKTFVINLLIIEFDQLILYIILLSKSILFFNINYKESVVQELNQI